MKAINILPVHFPRPIKRPAPPELEFVSVKLTKLEFLESKKSAICRQLKITSGVRELGLRSQLADVCAELDEENAKAEAQVGMKE